MKLPPLPKAAVALLKSPVYGSSLGQNGLRELKVDLNDERFDETICEAVAAVSAGHVQQ